MFDLTINLEPFYKGLEGFAECDSRLVTKDEIERFVDRFKALLHNACEQPNEPNSKLEIVDEGERNTLLQVFAGRRVHHSIDARTEQLVSNLADLTPDVVALEVGPSTLTFAQLDAASNAFSAKL